MRCATLKEVIAPLDMSPQPELSAATIRPKRDDDWPVVHRIYADGIATGYATFESEATGWE